jgi:hypothetical protein
MSDGNDYEVGYGKPPRKTQFRKGQSGNPSGRPKGAKTKVTQDDIENLILSEAYRTMEVTENGRPQRLNMVQAALRSLAVNAARGDFKAQKMFLTHVQTVEARREANISAGIGIWITYKKDWQAEFEHCDALGKKRREPLPHPDEIEMDMSTREIIFNGPVDEIEKAKWDAAAVQLAAAKTEIASLKQELQENPSNPDRLEGYLLDAEEEASFLEGFFPDQATRRRSGFDIRAWRGRNMKLHRLKLEGRYRELGRKPPEWWSGS